MTTIAVRDGIMACDTLVTGDYPCKAATKIIKGDSCLVGFSGDWIAGHHYAESYVQHREPIRADDDIELLVLRRSGIFLVDAHFREIEICEEFCAIGSGAPYAMMAMDMGLSAREAIERTAKFDEYTGLPVRKVKLA